MPKPERVNIPLLPVKVRTNKFPEGSVPDPEGVAKSEAEKKRREEAEVLKEDYRDGV